MTPFGGRVRSALTDDAASADRAWSAAELYKADMRNDKSERHAAATTQDRAVATTAR
ncbi:MAG: hypothetical protein V3R80_01245 [Candidatus Tectomicrobia bacterium]